MLRSPDNLSLVSKQQKRSRSLLFALIFVAAIFVVSRLFL